MNDEEKFFAWLDGELTEEEGAEVARRVASDPELSELAEQHRAMQARLKGAFDPIAEAPVPDRLASLIRQPEPGVADLAAARRARQRSHPWRPEPREWLAMAATLVAGILLGTTLQPRGNAPVAMEGGKLYAASSLDRALDSELASAPTNADVRIGVTFRDQSGAICRSFVQTRSSGLACRDSGGWQLRGLFAAPEGQAGDYRMAAGVDPNLAALIDSTMTGEPLDAAQERAARERAWK